MKRFAGLGLSVALLGALLPGVGVANAQTAADAGPLDVARETEPVVLLGKDLAAWAAPHDVTLERPHHEGKQCFFNEEGAGDTPLTPDESCTHSRYEDPDFSSQEHAKQSGTPLDQLLGFRWDPNEGFVEIPFQVDEMFTRYLSNNKSGFAFYSETDQHHSYAFEREGFRWTEDCSTAEPGDPHCAEVPDELRPCVARPAEPASTDPVQGLDTDDELVFLAKDAGQRAPAEVSLPAGIDDSYEIAVTDPVTQETTYAYAMKATPGGPKPAYDASNGYVRYQRDAAPNQNLFLFSQSSYDNYGNAPKGPVFDPATGACQVDDQGNLVIAQRRPSDHAWVTTPRYRFRYDGRWLMTQLRVNNADDGSPIQPPADATYGPDLIDQWKARAFQQRPSGQTPCCGFEEEVNNWGGSSILMGELSGPVRTIRETWGADSGTNVVRREVFYRDEVRFGTFLRVHPMPPLDGIYAQWDYNVGQVTTYYNPFNEDGVPIDGIDDESFGNDRIKIGRDGVSYNGQGAGNQSGCPEGLGDLDDVCVDNDIDSPDPMFSGMNAGLSWEEVAGPNGTLVWRNTIKQLTLGAAQTVFAVPYYRDDSHFDDGTGSNPGPHMHGRGVDGDEPSDSTFEGQPREHWDAAPTENDPEPDPVPGAPDFSDGRYYQGSIGTHGVHWLVVPESDNAGATVPLTEIASEWRSVVLPGDKGNVGEPYGRASDKPLIATAHREARTPATDVSTNVGCDPLDPTACLLPFPNDLFTVADSATATGRRVNLHPLAMPRNGTENTEGGEGKPIDPTEWNRNDGFSPGSMVMTLVPELDLHETWGTTQRPHGGELNQPGYFDHRDHIADIGLYAREDAPIVILDVTPGEDYLKRHPFWSELDTHPDAVAEGEQLLLLRPAANFKEGHRYVVALRNLRDTGGGAIRPRPEFLAYRSGTAAGPRQSHFDNAIFGPLTEAGINRDELYLAWDFTVASERNLSERVLHMRDRAFELLGDTDLADRIVQGDAPEFVIDSTENRTDNWTDSRGVSHSQAIRRVRGRVEVPNFMDRIQQTEAHLKAPGKQGIYYDVPAPGSRLLDLNLDGLPDQNPAEPEVNIPFVCDVPLNGEQNIPGLYGHGLLGDRDQINDFNKSPRRSGPFLGCAIDWWGMSTSDIPTVAAILVDGSNFPSLPDRAQQGFLNFMIVGRAAAHPDGFASDPAFQQDGGPLIKTADAEGTYLVYDGNSQGGIMGGALVALSPDISRGILSVLGMNYSTLLNRSVDWEGSFDEVTDDPQGALEELADGDVPFRYSAPFYAAYRDPVERQIIFDLMQMLWDRGEANGYAHHMTDDPYENTPSHEVMLQAAWSDHQVANVSAEVEARTIGAPIMTGLDEHWTYPTPEGPSFYEPKSYPHQGSALIYWDSGNGTPPNGNLPPSHNGDPHGHPRDERAASWQEAHFLLTGQMYDVCQSGDYLTRRHPDNGGTASCIEPDFAPGSQPPSPTPTPTPTATEPTPTPTPTETQPIATEVRFENTASTGQYSDEVAFTARLTQEDGTPLPGQTLRFELESAEGPRSFTDDTDQDGVASVVTTLTERPGNADLRVFYDGSETHDPDAEWMSFLIAKEDTAISLEVKGKGSKRTLVAVLSDADSDAGIESRAIEFFADDEPICRPAPVTGPNGTASCDPPGKYQGGHRTYAADFREDDYYLAAAAQRST